MDDVSFSGNLITDAIIDFHATFSHPNNTWAPAAIVLWNGGGIRSSIGLGNRIRELKWLSFPQRIQYLSCVMVYKALNHLAPEYMTGLFKITSETHSRNKTFG